jgi:hypothetical protein
MGGSNQPSKWWMPKDSNFGVPQPQYVIPAAYINKQSAEWPQGKLLPPCIIPPPVITFSAGFLTVNGASIYLGSMAPCPVPNVVSLSIPGIYNNAVYQSPQAVDGSSFVQIPFLMGNLGPDTAVNSVVRMFNLSKFILSPTWGTIPEVNIYFPFTVKPAVTATLAQLATGVVIPSVDSMEYVIVDVKIKTATSPAVQGNYFASMQMLWMPGACSYDLPSSDSSIYTHTMTVTPAGVSPGG